MPLKGKRGPNARTKRKQEISPADSTFTAPVLLGMAAALRTGRLDRNKISTTDDVEPGLRAYVRESGTVALHCHYEVGNSRPMIKVGELPGTTIEDARLLTRTIRAIAAKGIDVQDSLHERLFQELRAQGEDWTPDGRGEVVTITGGQVRAARAYLRWNIADLAEAAGVGTSTVKAVEKADGEPEIKGGGVLHTLEHREGVRAEALAKMRVAFEKAGIVFVKGGVIWR